MTKTTADSAIIALAAWRRELLAWIAQDAYPLWASNGVAPDGGFEECLDGKGKALPMQRRLRVLPRQIHAFAQAARLGWRGNVTHLLQRGLAYLEQRYRRPDGLYRTLVSASGSPLDESALLYDHAFVLLGFASAARMLGETAHFECRAGELWQLMERRWRGGAESFLPADGVKHMYLANPLMHLLEACIEWSSIGAGAEWANRAADLADLAVKRLADPHTGCIYEAYMIDWRPVATPDNKRVIEPGHQFEWAWLLLRCLHEHPVPRREAAMRLISFAEQHGVKDRFTVNAILDDGNCSDGNARLWPQTERLKANLLFFELTGDELFARRAAEAASSVNAYLQTSTRGLWLDMRDGRGHFAAAPSPASTLYHLVSAVAQLASFKPLLERPR